MFDPTPRSSHLSQPHAECRYCGTGVAWYSPHGPYRWIHTATGLERCTTGDWWRRRRARPTVDNG